MKQKTIDTGVCELFICELPEVSKDIEHFGISEQLELLGRLPDITDK